MNRHNLVHKPHPQPLSGREGSLFLLFFSPASLKIHNIPACNSGRQLFLLSLLFSDIALIILVEVNFFKFLKMSESLLGSVADAIKCTMVTHNTRPDGTDRHHACIFNPFSFWQCFMFSTSISAYFFWENTSTHCTKAKVIKWTACWFLMVSLGLT